MMALSLLLPTLTALAALGSASPMAVDTVIAVERDTRLEIEAPNGRVLVETWDRSAVRVRADGRSGRAMEASRSGALLRVRPRTGVDAPGSTDVRIAVPRWMDVRVHGQRLEVAIRGTEAEVLVETLGGSTVIEGGGGLVSVRTIQGSVSIRDTRGRVEVVTVNEGVVLDNIVGDLSVETTNGSVTMRRIRSASARATTINGSVSFEGEIRDDGRYAFSTHNGTVTVTIPPDANATVAVATYHGDFLSDFPVRLTGTVRQRQLNFTLGSGSARLELESFNGEIRLRRP